MIYRTLMSLASLYFWAIPTNSKVVLPIIGPKHFDVEVTSIAVTDSDRVDPFSSDRRKRSIMVSGFNPIKACQRRQLHPYMPPATAVFQDDKFAAYGLPNGSFQSLYLETCQENRKPGKGSPRPPPLVIFSGALGTSRLIYSSMLQSIAAAGYLVISVDHPYDADIVEFPDSTVITAANISSGAQIELALNTRTEDIRFLIQQLANTSLTTDLFPGSLRKQRVQQITVIGHSFGGAAAADAMLRDSSIAAAMNIDGTMFGRVLTSGLDRPFMLIGHENKTQETDPSWKTVWTLLRGWKKEVQVCGAAHYSFSDLPLVTAVLGLQDELPAEVEQVLGTVEGHRMTEIIVKLATSFLGVVSKCLSENVIDDATQRFSEVIDVE